MRPVSRSLSFVLLLLIASLSARAQETPRMGLEHSEAMFTALAAINVCGYDEDLQNSLPLRSEVRDEIVRNAQSVSAQNAIERTCRFIADHQLGDPSRNVSQYVSLALQLGDGPTFTPKGKESDLPPDAAYVQGFIPLMQSFYITTDLRKVYRQHSKQYDAVIDRLHQPVTNLLVSTDLYLRQPLTGYVGRNFLVYIEPMAAPGQTNSRNYGDDYYMVISPDKNGNVPLDQIRHTYLHFVMDPLVMKRANSIKRLEPVLNTVKSAPLDDSYKQDMALLLEESLIRAIEARLIGGPKGPEPMKLESVDRSMREGFVLTRFFYESLVRFEKDEISFKDSFADWLYNMDVGQLVKQAERVQFANAARPEPVGRSRKTTSTIDLAENALANGNNDAAANYANETIRTGGDKGRAYFVLARAATFSGKMDDAENYFSETIENAKDPRIIAWSHIYLGRISDLKEERPTALQHYRAALDADKNSADIKTAAERGIEKAYEAPKKNQ